VALLPFIDEARLLNALAKVSDQLSEEEKRRNTTGDDVIFIDSSSRLFDVFCFFYGKEKIETVNISKTFFFQNF